MTRSVLAALVAAVSFHASVHASPITTCGTAIPDKEVGTLAADLDCTDPATPAVSLGHRATLELAGHEIHGISADGQVSRNVVACTDRACTIVGPGRIVGNDGTGSYGACVSGADDGLLTMTSNGQGTIRVESCSTGVLGRTAKLTDVQAFSNMVGISVYKNVHLRNVEASGNQFGVIGRKIAGEDVQADTNTRFGIVGNAFHGAVKLKNLVASGNGDAAVIAWSVKLGGGGAVGNNGYGQGIDVVSATKPHVSDFSCIASGKIGESYIMGPPLLLSGSWGVCSGD